MVPVSPTMRHAPAQQDNPIRTIAFVAVGLGLFLILFFIANALKPTPATAPTAYTTIMSPDKAFSVDQPVGWDVTTAGTEGSEEGGVLFKNPIHTVKIDITTSQTGSAMADGTNALNNDESSQGDGSQSVPTTPAVETLHSNGQDEFSDDDSYVEQPMQTINTAYGETCISEFTVGTGSKTHGYRVTEVNTLKEVTTVCSCPERDWSLMQPVFMKIIRSITPGPG